MPERTTRIRIEAPLDRSPSPSTLKLEEQDPPREEGELKRELKDRHVAMISLGAVIGVGLFIGTATALHNAGPASLLIAFSLMGVVVFALTSALGEQVAQLPVPGGHVALAQRFVGRSFSFALGWCYWVCTVSESEGSAQRLLQYTWTIVMCAEYAALSILVEYWTEAIPRPACIVLFMVVSQAINMGGARVYGEFEFWLAIIKVISIVGLIILSFVLVAGGGPNHDPIGFRYWRDPGPFAQYKDVPGAWGKFLGFFSVFVTAAFSYIGTEITAITAAEAKNPRRSLPRAVKRVFIRIALFYVLGVFCIGLIVPSNDPRLVPGRKADASASPFVMAIQDAGIKVLPHIINGIIVASVVSATSSDLYVSSRTLYGMALDGTAPRFLARTTRWGQPWPCMLVPMAVSSLAFMSCGPAGVASTFQFFVAMTSQNGMICWCCILVSYLRFFHGLRAHGIDRHRTFAYTSPCQPYLSWFGLAFTLVVVLFSGWEVFADWDATAFVGSYIPIVAFFCLFLGHKLWTGAPFVSVEEMDFFSGSREGMDEDEPPRNAWQRIWKALL